MLYEVITLVYGMILSVIYSGFSEFQQPANVVFLEVTPPAQDWLTWALGSAKSLWSIFWIIFALLLGLRLLDLFV